MRVLHVTSSADPIGGGVIESVRQIGLHLEGQGYHSEVACLDCPDAPWLKGFPLPIHALGPSRTSYRFSATLLPWLRANAPRFDAVLVHGLWQYGSFAVWSALHGTETPYYVYPHGMLDPWFKRTYPLKHLKKTLYWPWGEYRVLRDARAVLFTCEEEKRLARQSFHLYRAREEVVPLGTAPPPEDTVKSRAAFLAAWPTLAGKRLLLFLSRIHVKKGCDLLLEAFAKVADSDPALHLIMAGPDRDGLQEVLQQLARSLGIEERVTWAGMLSGEQKWGAFYAAEAFVLPSHQENFGIAVAEALACGLPVLISNKINIWREIEQDGAGLVANDDVAGTTQMLEKWLIFDSTAKQEMGRAAIACYRKHFDIARMYESLLRILEAKPETVERK